MAELLRLPARLDATAAATLHGAHRASPPRAVDAAGVEFLDSAGLALLLDWEAHARAAGREFTVHDAPARYDALRAAHRVAR